MGLSLRAERGIKLFFINRKLHRWFRPLSDTLKKLGYLIELSEWCERQTHAAIDAADAEFRHDKRYTLYEFLLANKGLDRPMDYLEFGVAAGNSIRWWVEHNTDTESSFVGFDTFTGLPEDWSGGFGKGAFSTGGKTPDVKDVRCTFRAGLFQETLPKFLETYQRTDKRLVLHLDADLYSATLYALAALAPYLRKGDMLFFDEFNVPLHEYRAFTDFLAAFGFKYRVLGAVNTFHAVAMQLE